MILSTVAEKYYIISKVVETLALSLIGRHHPLIGGRAHILSCVQEMTAHQIGLNEPYLVSHKNLQFHVASRLKITYFST